MHMSRTQLLLIALFLLVFYACTESSAKELIPVNTKVLDCSFLGRLSDNSAVQCGYIDVPENHNEPNGHQIKITYAILKKKEATAQTYPIIYFMGGPGGKGLSQVNAFLNHPFRQKRDIILLDERGIGFSSGLPDIGPRLYSILAGNYELTEEKKLFKEAIESFLSENENQDFNLANYNVYQNAHDIGQLMDKLGYEKYNLYGASYGTTLSRVIMKYHPEKVRSVILNAPNPPNCQFYLNIHEMLEQAMDGIFKACKEDEDCHLHYPDLEQEFRSGIENIKSTPLEIEIAGDPFVLNAQDALLILRQCLYQSNALSTVPRFIRAMNNRDKTTLGRLALPTKSVLEVINMSMHFSSITYDDVTKETKILFEQSVKNSRLVEPGLGFIVSVVPMLENWHLGRASKEEKRFPKSDIPALILATTFDPATPAYKGKEMAQNLSNAYFFPVEGFGHGVLSRCSIRVMESFLDQPEKSPDANCLN